MKGTPVFPQCGFSAAVVQVLTDIGVKFKGIDVLTDPGLRQGIKDFCQLADHPAALCEGRVRRRLRHRARDVPDRRVAGTVEEQGRADHAGGVGRLSGMNKKPAGWPAFLLGVRIIGTERHEGLSREEFRRSHERGRRGEEGDAAAVLSRPGADDPAVIAQKAERAAIVAAREARGAARDEAKRAAAERERIETEARLAREQKEAAEKAAQDAVRAAALAVEQKAARDARYAARKARK